MIPGRQGTGPRAGSCLGEWISEYVDGVLTAPEHLAAERHLVACQGCRAEVDLERRLRATLRTDRSMSADLMAVLMSMSREIPVGGGADVAGRPAARPNSDLPGTPVAPTGPQPLLTALVSRSGELRVLSTAAPAQHRSVRRSAAFAGAAAGVSMAAVWALSAPVASGRPGHPITVIPSRPVAATQQQRPLDATVTVPIATLLAPARVANPAREAQSTP